MKTVLKEEGRNREEIKTSSSHHHHRSLLMGTKKAPLLMDATPQSQAPVTQVNNSYNQKYSGLNPSLYLHCSKHQFVCTQNPQPAEHPWIFRSVFSPALHWIAPTSTWPRWTRHPQTWALPTASSHRPPPPPLLARSPQASPWSKKSRTTSHSMKTITSPQLVASPPEHLTKVIKSLLWPRYISTCPFLRIFVSYVFLILLIRVNSLFCRCSHIKDCITSPALVSRDGQKPHWASAIPVQSQKAFFQPFCVWNIL